MLDERQIKAIEKKSTGSTITDIAIYAGVSRNTIYAWMREKEFTAELIKREQDFISATKSAVIGYAPKAVTMLKNLAEHAKSEKVRLEATCKLLDKVISNAVKIELSNGNNDQDNISQDLLDEELNEFDNEN